MERYNGGTETCVLGTELSRCRARGPHRPPIAKIALVSARTGGPVGARRPVVPLGAAGPFGASLPPLSPLTPIALGARRTRGPHRPALCRQFGDKFLKCLYASIDAVEFNTHRIAKLRIGAAIEENRGHSVFL